MRISTLAQEAGLPIGTVKFYLRSGLLHPGRALSATQAEYDQSHLDRLRLVRALLEVGGLSHAEILRVLHAMENPRNIEEGLREVHEISPWPDEAPAADLTEARELVDSLGWSVADDSPHLAGLARAIAALVSVGLAPSRERLRVYAEAASHVARNDMEWVRGVPDDDKVRVAAASAVLWDALLSSLRRLAAENQVARQLGGVPTPRTSSIPSA